MTTKLSFTTIVRNRDAVYKWRRRTPQSSKHWSSHMKVMAIGTLQALTPEQQRTYMPKEVPATLQIYLDGKMEQFWLRDEEAGVIFLMTVDSVEEADTILKALPLG